MGVGGAVEHVTLCCRTGSCWAIWSVASGGALQILVVQPTNRLLLAVSFISYFTTSKVSSQLHDLPVFEVNSCEQTSNGSLGFDPILQPFTAGHVVYETFWTRHEN